jgi:hypothetical protein
MTKPTSFIRAAAAVILTAGVPCCQHAKKKDASVPRTEIASVPAAKSGKSQVAAKDGMINITLVLGFKDTMVIIRSGDRCVFSGSVTTDPNTDKTVGFSVPRGPDGSVVLQVINRFLPEAVIREDSLVTFNSERNVLRVVDAKEFMKEFGHL